MKDFIQEKSLILANTAKEAFPITVPLKGMRGFIMGRDPILAVFVKKHSLIPIQLDVMIEGPIQEKNLIPANIVRKSLVIQVH